MSAEPILDVRNLRTTLTSQRGVVDVVDGLSFSVGRGETVALVGESGCGKSMTALSLMRLLPKSARISGGEVALAGRDLVALSNKEIGPLRGSELSMIFQDPISSLNPVLTVGEQLVEGIRCHTNLSSKAAKARAIDLLKIVNISDAESRFNEYPHRLSGGMCQRIGIAMAIACQPKLLIADESTTALDVTIQAQVLRLLQDLQTEFGMAILFITHDLGVVAEMARRVIVMYAGRKVEEGLVEDIFESPLHPYTKGLLASTVRSNATGGKRLAEIPGMVPGWHDRPPGCSFAPRCPWAAGRCFVDQPPLTEPEPGRHVACWMAEQTIESPKPYVASVSF